MIQAPQGNPFHFMDLSLELQDYAFKFLNISDLKITSRVCRHFNDLVLGTRVTYHGSQFKYSEAREIGKNREICQFLNSKEVIDIAAIKEAAQRWPNTSHLEIIKTDQNIIEICEDFLQQIAELFPSLKSLTLTSRSMDDFEAFKDLSSEDLMIFSDKCPNLTQLTLIDCTMISKEAYAYVIKKCSKLRTICLKGKNVTDQVVQVAMTHLTSLHSMQLFDADITRNAAQYFSIRKDTLTDLLLHSEPEDNENAFTDKDLAEVIAQQKRLRSIDFKGLSVGPISTKALDRLPNLSDRTIRS